MKNNLLRILSFILLLQFASVIGFSQTISSSDKKQLAKKEDSLRVLARQIILDSATEDRMISDSQFIRTLVRTMLIKNSFYYPLDSVIGVSKIYAPDTSFRIITWNISFSDYWHRQHGVIQMKPVNGVSKFIPLIDWSEMTTKAEDSVRTNKNWIGAVYYNIVRTQFKGKNFYTLFGVDYNSVRSNKKWIEVMAFNERNEPVFGGPYFTFDKDTIPKPPRFRHYIEYKKDAAALSNFIPDEKMILVDHLISETDEPDNKWTFVPDGDYEGFKWENGKWVHIEKVFTFKLQDGQAPVGEMLMDPRGNKNEEKLKEKSDKNTKPRPKENYPNY